MSATRIYLSKIQPPRQKSHVLRRPSLAKKFRLMLSAPLALLHAGPGYGKSTAFATFLADEHMDACWYQIDEQDTELSVFLQYIAESIRRQHAGFGSELLADLQTIRQVPTPEEVEMLAERFAHECLLVNGELLLVLDNYQYVQSSFFIDQWMQLAVRILPNHVKMVVLSRYLPPWPWLPLMKARGECFELTVADFAFTKEEMEALYADEYDLALSSEECDIIEEATLGWIMAVRGIGEKLSLGVELPRTLIELSHLIHLLEAEVFEKQEPFMRQFLQSTAVFQSISSDHCRHVAGSEGEFWLEEAVRRNLFLISTGDGMYRYHPLFRRLLLSKLAGDSERYVKLHQMAAQFYYQHGEEQRAFEHLRLIENWEQLGEWLFHVAERLLHTGKLDFLYEWSQQLPDEVKEKFHWLWFYQAEVERYRCLYPKAFASYRRFHTLSVQKQDVIGQCRGLEGLARVHLDSVQGLKAEELLKQAIQLLEPQDHEIAPRLYRLLAEIYTNRGDAKQAAYWYQRSQELEQLTEVELESRLLFRTGRLQSAIHLLESKWQSEQQQSIPTLTRSYRETTLLLAWIYGMNGEWEKGIAAAETAIRQGQAAHSPFVEACGYVRKAHAALMSQEYAPEQIRLYYLKGLRMMEELQSTRGKAETLLGLTLLHGREKALDLALAYGQRGLQETEAIRDDWLNSLVRLGVGIAYAYSGKDELARDAFTECVERLSRCGDSYAVAICHLWLSFLAYRQKQWEAFVPAVTHALSAIQSGEYNFLLQRPTMLTPNDVQRLMPILIEAQKRQIHPDYVSQLLTELGLQNVSFHPGYTLRIQALGQFRVWLGERELSDKAWQRGKAKQLLQLLLTKRQHLLAREEIFSYLWAESDEEAASRDFKVALNALNKALEPNREARASAFFIQRHGSSYGFNLASGYHIDVEEFEKLLTLGMAETEPRQAVSLLEKGLAYYQGEYLPDCRYEDWCMEERERLHVMFLRGAERLAQAYLDLEEYDAAIRWCEGIVRIDDCWEEAYRMLMIAYYRKNNRAQAIRWYEKCAAKLQEQLGVEPLPTTLETYRQIKGDTP
jgi:LuxR family maltose regulon positive regulatory protein